MWLTLTAAACLLLGTPSARAQQAPVVLVPVITDPTDAPRLVALAKVFRLALADRDMPTAAARYTATLEDAKANGDAFAAALDLSGEFATLRYDLYSDELLRTHALRLIELAKAHTAILLAAPIANRIVIKRVSRADGQSITLPDPCDAEFAHGALLELLPLQEVAEKAPSAPGRSLLASRTRRWLLGATGVSGLVTATLTVALAAKRRSLGTHFQDTASTDTDGDDWRASRAPMLVSASIASGSLSLAGAVFANNYDRRRLHWVSIPAAAFGTAALAWASSDIVQGSPCPTHANSECVRAQSQLDRGILLGLTSAPLLAIAATHLGHYIHRAINLNVDASPKSTSVSVAFLH